MSYDAGLFVFGSLVLVESSHWEDLRILNRFRVRGFSPLSLGYEGSYGAIPT